MANEMDKKEAAQASPPSGDAAAVAPVNPGPPAPPVETAPAKWYINHTTTAYPLSDNTKFRPGETRQLPPVDVERLRRKRAITEVGPPTGGVA